MASSSFNHDYAQEVTVTPTSDITDFTGKCVVTNGMATLICSYTKKGSSYTVANIMGLNMKPNFTSSDVYVIGKGASNTNIRIFNNGANLTIQEQTSVVQSDKSYINVTFPVG